MADRGPSKSKDAESEEDDYMNMAFAEDAAKPVETSLQRRQRLKKEGEAKGKTKSKDELEAEERSKREKALATSLDESNRGARLMAKMGYKPGQTLGQVADARLDPIAVTMKEGRTGIGHGSAKRERDKELLEEAQKRVKLGEQEYRVNVKEEAEEKRLRKQFYAAQKVCENLTTGEEGDAASSTKTPALKDVNVVWRGLVRYRREKEAKAQSEGRLQGLTDRLPTYEEFEKDEHDKIALPDDDEIDRLHRLDDVEDEELKEFEARPIEEQLHAATDYLRDTFQYCFWCKYRYPDAEMEGCPGPRENDHD